MSHVYSDDFRSIPVDAPPMISPRLRRAAGAFLFLLLVVGMAVWAYRLGTRDAAEIPIIRAMDVPPRVQPADPGGLQAAHQGLEVNSVLGGLPAPVPTLEATPRLQTPAVTLQEEDGPQGELILAAPDLPTITLPDEAGELPLPRDDATELPLADGSAALGDPVPEAPVASLPDLDVSALIQSLEASGESDGLVAGPRPRVRPAGHTASRAAPEPTPVAATAPPAAAAVATPPREVTSLGPGARLVQLGAFDSEALARQTWTQLLARHGDLLGSTSLYLERATNNARVFYRLRVAGFQTNDQTRLLCEQLRARGVDCIPVTLN